MKKIEKISLIGLGAMGVFFAPRLFETYGENFRVIADGERKRRLETKGVTVNGVNYKFPIVTPKEQGDPADLILIERPPRYRILPLMGRPWARPAMVWFTTAW